MTSWLPRGLGEIYRIGTKQAPVCISSSCPTDFKLCQICWCNKILALMTSSWWSLDLVIIC